MARHTTEDERDTMKLDVRQFLTFRMTRLQAKLNAQASHILKKHSGISLVQWRIIALLGADGPSTLTEMVASGEQDKGQFSRCIKSLVAAGLVCATQNQADRRQQILSLTKAGQAIYDSTIDIMRKRQRLLSKELSHEELATLYRAFDKLRVAADMRDIEI